MPSLYSLDNSFNKSISTSGTKLSVQLLTELDPLTKAIKRTPRSYPITTSAAITPLGSRVMTFTAMPAGLTRIPVGSSLVYTVGPIDYLIKVEEEITATNLTPIDVSGVPIEIPLSTTLKVYPMFILQGGNTVGLKFNDKEVETRTFESGIWSDATKVMAGATGDWGGLYPKSDEAFRNVILPCIKSTQEVFAEILYSNGMSRYGAAYIQNYNESGKNDDTLQSTWTFRFVTEIYFKGVDGVVI